MLQFDEYKVKLNNLLPQLDDLEQALNLDEAARQVDILEAECAADGFWDNPENSQKVLQKLKQEKNKLESQAKRRSSWDDMMVLCEMGNEEEDESLLPELEEEYATLHPEHGVRPAPDPAHRGVRRHQRHSRPSMPAPAAPRPRTGRRCSTGCTPAGPSATASPTRSWTIRRATRPASSPPPSCIEGENAYGYPAERERRPPSGPRLPLRRQRPAADLLRRRGGHAGDARGRLTIEIRPEDIEMQVYRSSGAGGQHVNKTSSAVRLIHMPTGVVVSCQTERSQFQNRDNCMKMLRAKLVELQGCRSTRRRSPTSRASS